MSCFSLFVFLNVDNITKTKTNLLKINLLSCYILFRARALLTASGPVVNPESASAPGGLAGGGAGGAGGGAQPPAGWRVDVLGAASPTQSPSPIVWLNDIEVRHPGRRQACLGGCIG